MNSVFKFLCTFTAGVFISACGGSGGAESPPLPPPSTPVQPEQPPVPNPEPATDHAGLVPINPLVPDENEHLSGGAITVFIKNEDAFSGRPTPVKQDFRFDGNFTSGDHIFRTPNQNFGPLLNTSTCQGCHLNDGRGVLPKSENAPFTSMLVKISDAFGQADPTYGAQIQTFSASSFNTSDFSAGWPRHDGSINGTTNLGEAFVFIRYEDLNLQYSDGTPVTLRKPIYYIRDLSFGAFVDDIQFSPRISPQVFGAGLLEAIPSEHIEALADQSDRNGDGISGKVSRVTNVITDADAIGRFTYKAQTPSVLQQAAAAFNGDMGNTTTLFPNENCTQNQLTCLNDAALERNPDTPDVSDRELAMVEFYNRVLAVPARRGYNENSNAWDEDILRGRTRFFELGCASCHTPRHKTGIAKGSELGEITLTGLEANPSDIAFLSEQTIYPYTDLLLHDMGGQCEIRQETDQGLSCESGADCLYVQRCEGLADGVIQGNAIGSEWKTPPLWGLGLVQTVNPNATFLHDGRARTIEEAILWHAGESSDAQAAFLALDKEARADLLSFLKSL